MNRPDPITDRARDLFDRASDGLDQGMAFRLRRARHDAQQPRPVRRALPMFVPAGAFAAAALALGLAWWLPQHAAVAPAADPPVAISTAELDALVIEEDAELYAWLAEAPVATVAAGPQL
jgi:hypothetical protein